MADSGSGWTVVDFERMRGDFPIRTFLATLEGRNKAESAALIQQVAARGNQLREPAPRKSREPSGCLNCGAAISYGSSTAFNPGA